MTSSTRVSAALVPTSSRAAFRRSAFRPARSTRPPAATTRRATARPMPEEPPVIRTRLPARTEGAALTTDRPFRTTLHLGWNQLLQLTKTTEDRQMPVAQLDSAA